MTTARYKGAGDRKGKGPGVGLRCSEIRQNLQLSSVPGEDPVPVPMRFPSLAFPSYGFPCPWLFLSPAPGDLTTCFRNGKSRRALGGFSEKAGGY